MHLNGLQWEPPVSQTGLGVVKIIRDPGQNSVNKMGKITMSHMVMKTSRTKNAETGVTSSEAWQECVSKGWDYDSLHGSLEDWDSWIHSPLILFTLIKLGIESSGDSAASENLYGIEKESTQLLRWRASWNRYLTFVGAWHVAGVRGAQIFQLFHTCLGIPKPYLIWQAGWKKVYQQNAFMKCFVQGELLSHHESKGN